MAHIESVSHSSGWREYGSVGLTMVLALVLAALARAMLGYPPCQVDERNWAAIARIVQSGQEWPISGPLHFKTSQLLAAAWSLEPETALALLGMASAPAVVFGLWLAYRWMGLPNPWQALALLATSSYFWAPLLDSRPQQWGQALLVMGLALLWRALHEPRPSDPRWRLGWAAVAALTAAVHILSFAFLLFAAAAMVLTRSMRSPAVSGGWALLLSGVVPGLLLILLVPPLYGLMIRDLLDNHLGPRKVAILAVGLAALGALAYALHRARQQVGPKVQRWAQAALSRLAAIRPRVIFSTGLVAAAALLTTQALILPPEAWIPYRGSVALFFGAQAGNLFLLLVLALGVSRLLAISSGTNDTPAGRLQPLLFALCGSFAALCAAGLAASFLMLHTNWLLRTLNFGLPLIVPVASLAFRAAPHRTWLVCLPFAALSYIAAVRPSAVFSCG